MLNTKRSRLAPEQISMLTAVILISFVMYIYTNGDVIKEIFIRIATMCNLQSESSVNYSMFLDEKIM